MKIGPGTVFEEERRLKISDAFNFGHFKFLTKLCPKFKTFEIFGN